MREDPPKNPDLFIKSVYLFLMFQLQLPSKYAPFAAIHLLRLFFHCSKQLLNLSILIPLSISAIFCCHLFHIDKIFFFMQVNKKSCLVTLGKWGGVRHKGHAVLCQKLLNTQHSLDGCACKSPIVKWANALKQSSRKIH